MSQSTKQRISGKRVKAARRASRVIRDVSGSTIKGTVPDNAGKAFGARTEAERAAKEIVRTTNGRQSFRRRGREGFTIGHAAFAKISAVEGLYFTAEMKKDLQELDRKGLSPEARRRFLIARYGK